MFLLSQFLYRPTPKLQLCYGTVLVMLLFYSLKNNQATTYKSDQIKRICSLLDRISCCFSHAKFAVTSNEQLIDPNAFYTYCWFLLKLLKLKQKQYQTYDATN